MYQGPSEGGPFTICTCLWSQIDNEKKTHGYIMLEFEIYLVLVHSLPSLLYNRSCSSRETDMDIQRKDISALSCRYQDPSSIKHAHIRKSSEDKLPGFRIIRMARKKTFFGKVNGVTRAPYICVMNGSEKVKMGLSPLFKLLATSCIGIFSLCCLTSVHITVMQV